LNAKKAILIKNKNLHRQTYKTQRISIKKQPFAVQGIYFRYYSNITKVKVHNERLKPSFCIFLSLQNKVLFIFTLYNQALIVENLHINFSNKK